MNFEEDDEQSSGNAMPENSNEDYFNEANRDMIILGKNVYVRVNKRPEEVLLATLRNEATKLARSVVKHVVITREKIGRGIKAVQELFWGNSCYAIIYCVLRDYFAYDKKLKYFEDDINFLSKELHFDYLCPLNTLASAFSRNKYLKLSISKWPERGVKKRSILLANAFYLAIKEKD